MYAHMYHALIIVKDRSMPLELRKIKHFPYSDIRISLPDGLPSFFPNKSNFTRSVQLASSLSLSLFLL